MNGIHFWLCDLKVFPAERRLAMVASGINAMHYVGVDVHQRRSSVCILNGDGKRVKEFSVNGNWADLLEQMQRLPRPFAVCYEASCGYGYLHEKFSALANSVQVAQ